MLILSTTISNEGILWTMLTNPDENAEQLNKV